LTAATAYETTLNQFFDWCDRNNTCALNGGNNSSAIFDQILLQAAQSPIPAPGCNGTCQPNVTTEDIRYNVNGFLQFVDFQFAPNWIDLGGALAEAAQGNGTALSTPLVTTSTDTGMQGSSFVNLAYGCQDANHTTKSYEDLRQMIDAIRPFAPRSLGASDTWSHQSQCINWPEPTSFGERPLNVSSKSPTVLIAGSVYDPTCSIAWAVQLRNELPNRVSITRNGYGHTSFFLNGQTKAAIDTFLGTGKLPKDGTVYRT
jgi:hypothetical protein